MAVPKSDRLHEFRQSLVLRSTAVCITVTGDRQASLHDAMLSSNAQPNGICMSTVVAIIDTNFAIINTNFCEHYYRYFDYFGTVIAPIRLDSFRSRLLRRMRRMGSPRSARSVRSLCRVSAL